MANFRLNIPQLFQVVQSELFVVNKRDRYNLFVTSGNALNAPIRTKVTIGLYGIFEGLDAFAYCPLGDLEVFGLPQRFLIDLDGFEDRVTDVGFWAFESLLVGAPSSLPLTILDFTFDADQQF